MGRLIRASAALVAWLGSSIAAPVMACPACIAASTAGTRLGYYVSAGILSITPLLIMGLGVSYIAFKRGRAAREQRESGDRH